MNNHEEKARELKKTYNCSIAVYKTFMEDYELDGVIPEPRSDAGKCGALIAAEKVLKELGKEDKIEELENRFKAKFGYITCVDLMRTERRCFDYVGESSKMVDEYLDEKK